MDLKMENVYITYNDMGKPIYKIGDLGLVRSLEPLDASDGEDTASLTAASRNDAVCLGPCATLACDGAALGEGTTPVTL